MWRFSEENGSNRLTYLPRLAFEHHGPIASKGEKVLI